MYDFFSIVLKNGDIIYDLNTTSYEDLIEKAGVVDDTTDTDELSFVKIAISPNNDVFSEDWSLKIDQSIEPNWFNEEYERKCMEVFYKEVYPKCVFIGRKNLIFKNRQNLFLKDCTADLYDSSADLYASSVNLYGSSKVNLFKSSHVELFESSQAVLHDTSSARLNGSSKATLFNSSSADLYGSSKATLFDSSSANLYGSSWADLNNSSKATLFDSSEANLNGSSWADLHDDATGICFSEKVSFTTLNRSVVIDRSKKGEFQIIPPNRLRRN